MQVPPLREAAPRRGRDDKARKAGMTNIKDGRENEKGTAEKWELRKRRSSHIVRLCWWGRLVVVLGGFEAGLLSVGLGHVFALLGLAVIAGAFFVVDAALGVDPDHALLRRGAAAAVVVAAALVSAGLALVPVIFLVVSTVASAAFLVPSAVAVAAFLVPSTVAVVAFLVVSTVASAGFLCSIGGSGVAAFLVPSTVALVAFLVVSAVAVAAFLVASTVASVAFFVVSAVDLAAFLVVSAVASDAFFVVSAVDLAAFLVVSAVASAAVGRRRTLLLLLGGGGGGVGGGEVWAATTATPSTSMSPTIANFRNCFFIWENLLLCGRAVSRRCVEGIDSAAAPPFGGMERCGYAGKGILHGGRRGTKSGEIPPQRHGEHGEELGKGKSAAD